MNFWDVFIKEIICKERIKPHTYQVYEPRNSLKIQAGLIDSFSTTLFLSVSHLQYLLSSSQTSALPPFLSLQFELNVEKNVSKKKTYLDCSHLLPRALCLSFLLLLLLFHLLSTNERDYPSSKYRRRCKHSLCSRRSSIFFFLQEEEKGRPALRMGGHFPRSMRVDGSYRQQHGMIKYRVW